MKEQILALLAPVINMALKMVLKPLFQGLIEKEPVHGKVALAALYPIIDAELEPLAKSSETALDDGTVEAIKSVIEDVAAEAGITLSNVDDD